MKKVIKWIFSLLFMILLSPIIISIFILIIIPIGIWQFYFYNATLDESIYGEDVYFMYSQKLFYFVKKVILIELSFLVIIVLYFLPYIDNPYKDTVAISNVILATFLYIF